MAEPELEMPTFIVHVEPSPELAVAHIPEARQRLNITRPRKIDFPWGGMSVRYCISNARLWESLPRLKAFTQNGIEYTPEDCVVLNTEERERLRLPSPLHSSPELRTGEHLAYLLEIRGRESSACQDETEASDLDSDTGDIISAKQDPSLSGGPRNGLSAGKSSPEVYVLIAYFHRPEDLKMTKNRPSKRCAWHSRRELFLGDWLQIYSAENLKNVADVILWDEAAEPHGDHHSERVAVARGDSFMMLIHSSLEEAGRLPAFPISGSSPKDQPDTKPGLEIQAHVRLGLINEYLPKGGNQKFFTEPRKYCVCGKPHNPDLTLIVCKKCGIYQHARCSAADCVRRLRIARFGVDDSDGSPWWRRSQLSFDPFEEPIRTKGRKGDMSTFKSFPYRNHPRSDAIVDFARGGFIATAYGDLNPDPGAGYLAGGSRGLSTSKIPWCRHSDPPLIARDDSMPVVWRVGVIDFMDARGVVKMPSMDWVIAHSGRWDVPKTSPLDRADSGYNSSEQIPRGAIPIEVKTEITTASQPKTNRASKGTRAVEPRGSRGDLRSENLHTGPVSPETTSDDTVDNAPIRRRRSVQKAKPETPRPAQRKATATKKKGGSDAVPAKPVSNPGRRGVKRKVESLEIVPPADDFTTSCPPSAVSFSGFRAINMPGPHSSVSSFASSSTRCSVSVTTTPLSSVPPPDPASSPPPSKQRQRRGMRAVVAMSSPTVTPDPAPLKSQGDDSAAPQPPRGRLVIVCLSCLGCGAPFD